MTEKYTTENGLRVVLDSMPYMRSAAIEIYIKCGSVFENKENNGISHFIEHLLFKGTKRRSSRQINEESDELGGTLNAFTAEEDTCVYIRTLGENVLCALDLVLDIVGDPAFDENLFENEKNVILEEIAAADDDPEDAAEELLMSNMFRTHPIGMPVLGSEKNVRSFTREQVVEYYNEHYRPENIVVSIAGNFDVEAVKTYIGSVRLFNEKTSKKDTPFQIFPEISGGISVKKRHISQIRFVSAWQAVPVTDERFCAFALLNEVLGGDDSSRLFCRLREENGLVYDVDSFIPEYLCTGIIVITTSFSPENADKVRRIIYEEIEKLCLYGVTEDELRRARRNRITAVRMSEEDTASVASFNGKRELSGIALTNDGVIALYNRVTNADIIAAARFAFSDKSKECVAIVGDVK